MSIRESQAGDRIRCAGCGDTFYVPAYREVTQLPLDASADRIVVSTSQRGQANAKSDTPLFQDAQRMYRVVYQGLRLFRLTLVVALLLVGVVFLFLALPGKLTAMPIFRAVTAVLVFAAMGISFFSWAGLLMWGAVPDWKARRQWGAFLLLEVIGNSTPFLVDAPAGVVLSAFLHFSALYFLYAYFLRMGWLIKSKRLVKYSKWLLNFLVFVLILSVTSGILAMVLENSGVFPNTNPMLVMLPAAFGTFLLFIQIFPVVHLTIAEMRLQSIRNSSRRLAKNSNQ